jgi:hypothetical protein
MSSSRPTPQFSRAEATIGSRGYPKKRAALWGVGCNCLSGLPYAALACSFHLSADSGYLGSYRIATAPEASSSLLTSFK